MAKKLTAASEPRAVNFEEAIVELESIVRRLEQGGGALEQALEDYSTAIQLLKSCHQRLELAERKIELLSGVDAQGNPIAEVIEETEISLEQKQKSRSERRTAGGGRPPAQSSDSDHLGAGDSLFS